MTLKQFRNYLKDQIKQVGGVRELSRRTGLSPSAISKVQNGEETPSNDFLAVFGFKRNITIVKK